ncbi:MAG: hypothetical protein IPN69_22490 [Acidobacteria bacterium]|nr:hypothetical protein [Acidobacteriota bacterium]
MKHVLRLAVLLSITALTCSQTPSTLDGTSTCFPVNFRYLIVKDTMLSGRSREVELFQERKSFNRDNLQQLFVHLSKQYPEPVNLTVEVKTDWSQISIPTECPGTGRSNVDVLKGELDGIDARFYRRGGNEYFKYVESSDSTEVRTVLIKGQIRSTESKTNTVSN